MKIQKKIFLAIRNTNGFSLMELFVVLAIVGMMAAMMLPSYISGMPDRRLQAAARELYGAMQQTKLLAVKENRDRSLFFETDSGRDFYYIDKNGDKSFSKNEEKMVILSERDVRFGIGAGASSLSDAKTRYNATDPAAAPTFSITFTPKGTLSASSASRTVYIENNSNPSKSFAVIAQTSGAVKIIHFDGSQWR